MSSTKEKWEKLTKKTCEWEADGVHYDVDDLRKIVNLLDGTKAGEKLAKDVCIDVGGTQGSMRVWDRAIDKLKKADLVFYDKAARVHKRVEEESAVEEEPTLAPFRVEGDSNPLEPVVSEPFREPEVAGPDAALEPVVADAQPGEPAAPPVAKALQAFHCFSCGKAHGAEIPVPPGELLENDPPPVVGWFATNHTNRDAYIKIASVLKLKLVLDPGPIKRVVVFCNDLCYYEQRTPYGNIYANPKKIPEWRRRQLRGYACEDRRS